MKMKCYYVMVVFFKKNCEKRNKDELGKCFNREDQKDIIFKNPKT